VVPGYLISECPKAPLVGELDVLLESWMRIKFLRNWKQEDFFSVYVTLYACGFKQLSRLAGEHSLINVLEPVRVKTIRSEPKINDTHRFLAFASQALIENGLKLHLIVIWGRKPLGYKTV